MISPSQQAAIAGVRLELLSPVEPAAFGRFGPARCLAKILEKGDAQHFPKKGLQLKTALNKGVRARLCPPIVFRPARSLP